MLMRSDPFGDPGPVSQQASGSSPQVPMDGYRGSDGYVLRFDMPGIDPASVELTVEDNVLFVSAVRRPEPADGTEVFARERPHGRLNRQVQLSGRLDVGRIEASYDSGVLNVRIPVVGPPTARRIAVSVGSAA